MPKLVDVLVGLKVLMMIEIQVQPRALTPRRLEQQETLSSLNQWVAVFKNFYRRCIYYSFFLKPGLTWTSNTEDRGFARRRNDHTQTRQASHECAEKME